MKITILTDDINSWFVSYGKKLVKNLKNQNHQVLYVFDQSEIKNGDVCFFLSCTRVVKEEFLKMNKYNIVVHASDLPKGKGFSPLQWQILEGKDEICLTLFEAVNEIDAGPFYIKDKLLLKGNELYLELRMKLGIKIIDMCTFFINNISKLKPIKQSGNSSYYRRRNSSDDELNINKSIKEQFNHFRIADNQNYPLWFEYKKNKYIIKIDKVG